AGEVVRAQCRPGNCGLECGIEPSCTVIPVHNRLRGRRASRLNFRPLFRGPLSLRLVLRRDDLFFRKSPVPYVPSYVGLSANNIANGEAFIRSYLTGLLAASARHREVSMNSTPIFKVAKMQSRNCAQISTFDRDSVGIG